jgi:hypothetical protein
VVYGLWFMVILISAVMINCLPNKRNGMLSFR